MYQASDTNAAQKVCRILKMLSNPQAMRLSDIAAGSGVSTPTTSRILETLIAEGFVRRDAADKRYQLGDEALILGMAMQGRDHVRQRARACLVRLAARTGDTVLLSTRHGLESVCVDREFGDYPIRANYLEVGSRRPLGAGAGSLALLAWLPAAEAREVIRLLEPRMAARYPALTPQRLRDEILQARRQGHVLLLDVVVEQMGAIAVPILGADGQAVAALSVAALSERIRTRQTMLAELLRQEASRLSVTERAGEAA